MAGGSFGRRKARQDVVDLTHEGDHAGLLHQNAAKEVGKRWAFLFGPLWGQNLDHVADLAREGFKLTLKRLAVFEKSVLGVIHLFHEFADANELTGYSAKVCCIGVGRKGHQDDPWVSRLGWVASKAFNEAGSALPPRV
jgi:hypothetical protein